MYLHFVHEKRKSYTFKINIDKYTHNVKHCIPQFPNLKHHLSLHNVSL